MIPHIELGPDKLRALYDSFLKGIDKEATLAIWGEHSRQFREFWTNRIMGSPEQPLSDSEIDQIVRILDRNGKGNTKNSVAVARAMVAQGAWRRMFKDIKATEKLRTLLNNIFTHPSEQIQPYIDELYTFNDGRKNSLTGKSGNALNDMIFAFNPSQYISVISLNDRKKVIDYFEFAGGPDFENDTPGRKIYLSNKTIIEGFGQLGIAEPPRILSEFLYTTLRDYWRGEEVSETPEAIQESEEQELEQVDIGDQSLFYMEKELENFLIVNWDNTELGKKYELIEEEGELVSQQYQTDIGRIDILARDKQTKQYVVIELKKNQTSDDTVGQLARYMGWLEEKKTNNQPVKGIIIAAKYDERLYYALKKMKDVEVYLYQIDFRLRGFKK